MFFFPCICVTCSVLVLDPEERTLSLYRPGRDGAAIDFEGPLDALFRSPHATASTPGDVISWLKLSANDPAKFTIFFQDRSTSSGSTTSSGSAASATASPSNKQPPLRIQPLYLYMQTKGNKKAIEAAREEMFIAVRNNGLLQYPDRKK